MIKIFSVTFIVTMLSLSHLGAMEENPKPFLKKCSQGIMQDINQLKPYYQAIQQIRITLDSIAHKLNYETGFDGDPTPNKFFRRTPQYLFLETHSVYSDEMLVNLWSPFGQIKLLCGGFIPEVLQISKEFFSSVNWKLEDVTEKVMSYEYNQEINQKEQLFFKPEKHKFFLIKSVGCINLSPENSTEELIIFTHVNLSDGQYEKDRVLFEKISDGRNCF